jgi:hypothetical protein
LTKKAIYAILIKVSRLQLVWQRILQEKFFSDAVLTPALHPPIQELISFNALMYLFPILIQFDLFARSNSEIIENL